MRIKKQEYLLLRQQLHAYDTGSIGDGSRYFGICTGDYF